MISTIVQDQPEVDSLAELNSIPSGPVQSTPSSFHRDDLPIGLHWEPQEKVVRRGKKPAAHFLIHTFVVSLVAFGLSWVVWRCTLQLVAARGRESAAFNRLLAAGGEKDSSLCRSSQEEEEEEGMTRQDTTRQSVRGSPGLTPEQRDALINAHAVLLASGSLAVFAEDIVLCLPPQERHKATTLLVSLIIVESAALVALVGEPVRGTLAAVCSVVGRMMQTVAETLEPARIKGAEAKYKALSRILNMLKDSEHPPPPLPEPERLKRLRELISLQTLAQNQARSAIQSLVKVYRPVMKLNNELIPRSLILLTHTAHARKHQVIRDKLLCQWLLKNEGPYAHSPVLPDAYVKFILQYEQPVYGELLRELTDPSSFYARHSSYSSAADDDISAQEQQLAEEGLLEDAATDDDDDDEDEDSEDEEDGQQSLRKRKQEQRNSAIWPSLMDLIAQYAQLIPGSRASTSSSSPSPPAQPSPEKTQTSESENSTPVVLRRQRVETLDEGGSPDDVWVRRRSFFLSPPPQASSDSDSFYSASEGEQLSASPHRSSEESWGRGEPHASRKSRSPRLAYSPVGRGGASAERDSGDGYLSGAVAQQQLTDSSRSTSNSSMTFLQELQSSSEDDETVDWGSARRLRRAPFVSQESQIQGVQTPEGDAAATTEGSTTPSLKSKEGSQE
ncbi:hypothetical protein, conserved [Eimeria brunetti]|uniref:Transmembrane protein n=1 Tax=Eimeria brunetti TaxID=51314 RepID=U6LLL7_9EIME|nr:hypothetical protein, conserved [Eimeria brunetti]